MLILAHFFERPYNLCESDVGGYKLDVYKRQMRAHLYASLGALKTGCDIMLKKEGVRLDAITRCV